MTGRWLFKGPAVIAFAAALGNAGCRDDARVVAPLRSPASVAASGGGPRWTRFSADVVVTLSAVVPATMDQRSVPPRLSFHIEQAQAASGRWVSTYSAIRSPITNALGDRETEVQAVSRAEVDETGAIALFDATGAEIALPRSQNVVASVGHAFGGETRNRVLDAIGAWRGRGLAARADVSSPGVAEGRRAWASGFVVDSAQNLAALAAFRSRSQRSGSEGSQMHFLAATGRGSIDVVVDSGTGNVVQVRHQPVQGPATRVSYGYTAMGRGYYVRALTRQEREADGTHPAMVFETLLTNLRLDVGRSQ